MNYSGSTQKCWQGRDFSAPIDSEWLCTEPPERPPPQLLRAAATPAAAPRVPSNVEPQAHSPLLKLDDAALDHILAIVNGWGLEGRRTLLALSQCCRQLRCCALPLLDQHGPEAWADDCRRTAPFCSWGGLQRQVKDWQKRQANSGGGGGEWSGAVNWRACYSALLALARDPKAEGMRNGMRIAGVIDGMVQELLQPLSPEEEEAAGAAGTDAAPAAGSEAAAAAGTDAAERG